MSNMVAYDYLPVRCSWQSYLKARATVDNHSQVCHKKKELLKALHSSSGGLSAPNVSTTTTRSAAEPYLPPRHKDLGPIRWWSYDLFDKKGKPLSTEYYKDKVLLATRAPKRYEGPPRPPSAMEQVIRTLQIESQSFPILALQHQRRCHSAQFTRKPITTLNTGVASFTK
eukprot:PhF_6_TR41022/c0_g1_i1/m.62130